MKQQTQDTTQESQQGFKFNYTEKEKARKDLIVKQNLNDLGIEVY